MIDLQRIKRHPTKGRIFLEMLVNAPALFLMFYGLKCLFTLHATIPAPDQGEYHRSLLLRHKTCSGGCSLVIG
jgi:hypothetical protein